MEPATKQDVTDAVNQLRVEWRQEMISQTRWIATLFLIQFLATISANVGILALMN